MKVFTAGYYVDYEGGTVIGIFSTFENAKAAIMATPAGYKDYCGYVEEVEVDRPVEKTKFSVWSEVVYFPAVEVDDEDHETGYAFEEE